MSRDKLEEILNIEEETNENLLKFAEKQNKILMAIIAPYTSVRVSPVEIKSAQLGLYEEFAVEAALDKIKEKVKGQAEVILLLNSPGGHVSSSYKIAKTLRENFSKITVCVPHIAASGGTLIALVGNEIIMGPMSNLSPIDVQVNYQGLNVSVNNMARSLMRLGEYFKDKRVEEAPYPYKALSDKLDPIVHEELEGLSYSMRMYATELLMKSGHPEDKVPELVDALTTGFPNHQHVIDYELAQKLGLPVKKSSEYAEMWNLMKAWLSGYMLQSEDKHILRYVVPSSLDNGQKNKKTE